MWNVVTDKMYRNVQHIFPTQQNDVGILVEILKENPAVEKIIVFGSSVTSACNPWSDIDVFVQLSKKIVLRHPQCGVPLDLWTNYDVDDRLMTEINEKGVVVYEQ